MQIPNMMPVFVLCMIAAAVLGWVVIEGAIWVFSHVEIAWVADGASLQAGKE